MKQNKSKFLKLIAIVAIVFQFYSCENEPVELNSTTKDVSNSGNSVLGKKKINPFTIENMQKAYQSLLNNPTASKYPNSGEYYRSNFSGYQIETTHYYVRFHPQDSIQYDKIANDSILAVSDVPFEYDIDTDGEKYQDPSLIGTDFTYYYSVCPIDYQVPEGVPYEIITNLHFTKEDMIGNNPTEIQIQEIDFYYDLNLETLKLTNNLEINEKEELIYLFTSPDGTQQQLTYQQAINQGLSLEEVIIDFSEIEALERRRSWSPSGTITVNEDAINQNIGVNGALIRVRKWGWLVIRTANTNSNGYFQTSSTRTKKVKYALYYQHQPFFTVKAGTAFWNARDRGTATHTRSAWNRHYSSGVKKFYALIHNAAYDYYSRIVNVYNISNPGFFKRIVGKNWYYASSHYVNSFQSTFSFYDIRITIGSNGAYRGSDGIYATTIHELTHAGHRNMDSGMFSTFHSGSCNRAVLIESWAEGVETIVTNDRYSNLANNFLATNRYNDTNLRRWNDYRQTQTVTDMNEYTPIVADLVDNLNQQLIPNIPGTQPIDRVTGFTLNQIQSSLNNCRDIDCWQNKLRDNYNNPTKDNLRELFDYVHTVRNNMNSNCN
ncbi:hypothetical protein FLGE108171_15500 [Flavobacterium gelidilacus]|uniref:hypothetical protein n=1 Tax=Flavobacterium gelidilacus TaxID=206041 RepID=UPI000406FC60|nr:hypothetical protein [Flavobacterium gelidilacus]